MKQGLLNYKRSSFDKLPNVGKHKKRIRKKLIKQLGYPYFRRSRFDGFYNMHMGLEYLGKYAYKSNGDYSIDAIKYSLGVK